MIVGFYYSHQRDHNKTDYFLAGRNVGWFAIGASIFAANISSEHFIGLAGYGSTRGLAVGNIEWMAIIFILILGWFFTPIFLKSGIFTMPEYFGKRYDSKCRLYISGLSIIAYILTKVTVTLIAGGLLLEKVFGFDMYISAIIMVMLTGLYAIVGGLRAVIYTSMVQAFLLIGGAVILTIIGLNAVGGWSGLHEKLPESYFSFINPVSDPDFPWTGILFGAPILAIWYWCTDHYIVQRILSAKDINAARSGSIFAGFLKILPVFILVLPGLIAAALFPGIKGDEAYPTLVASTLLPVGIKGIVIAGFLAALMSSLASTFNSTATVFALDFYGYFYPNASERKLVLVGRLATTVLVITGILWIPFTKIINTHLYVYLQSVQAYISPPIVAVFLLGIFWKGANAKAAIWSLIVGGIFGALRLILEIFQPAFVYDNLFLSIFVEMNFLHFATFLFVVCLMTIIIVSIYQKIAASDTIQQLIFKWNYVLKTQIVSGNVNQCENINRANWMFSATLLIILIGLFTGFLN